MLSGNNKKMQTAIEHYVKFRGEIASIPKIKPQMHIQNMKYNIIILKEISFDGPETLSKPLA